MLCITVAKDEKWATVIASKVIGASKHIDYALWHWKAGDVKALKLPLSKFIFVNAAGVVDEVILSDQLKTRGINFKTAKRDSHPLTDQEQWEIEAAIELVRTGAVVQAAGATAGQADPAGEATGTAIDVAPAATDSSNTDADATAPESTASLDNADASPESTTGADEGQDQGTSADVPLALVKPSRIAHQKKRR